MFIDANSLFLATSDNKITVYDRSTTDLAILGEIPCHQGNIDCLCVVRREQVFQETAPLKHYKSLNQIESYLMAGLDTGDIHVYQNSVSNYRLLEIFQGHGDKVSQLALADSHFLYSGSYDMSIRNWDLREMTVRIRDRWILFREDVQST